MFEDTPSTQLLDSLREFSDLFSIPSLRQFCDNIANDKEELNSVDTHLRELKGLFLNTTRCADVKFIFNGKSWICKFMSVQILCVYYVLVSPSLVSHVN